MAHHLPELHVVAFVDEQITDPTDEIEAQIHLPATLDRPAPEHLAHHVAALDHVTEHDDRDEEALSYRESGQQEQR